MLKGCFELFLADMERVRIPEMIVVGISSDNRLSDFTPIHSLEIDGRIDSGLSATGNGGAFLRYIRDELVPYIDGHYRTQPYRILAAHSLGGLFALYAKETSPELFASEILMSPAFYGGNKKVLLDFPEFLRAHPHLAGSCYLTIGDEPGAKGRVDTLADELKGSAPAGFHWRYVSYPGEDHFSLPYKSLYDGLKFIYADWYFNVWDNDHSMGDAYRIKGEKALAIENYKRSLELNPNNENGKEQLKKYGVK
jgi:predicted alpha/beta superfamily hydrolase